LGQTQGLPVTCEVLVAHPLLDDTAYERCGNLIQLNPPIRENAHVAALWAGPLAGDIDCIATDHAPHAVEEQSRANVWEACGASLVWRPPATHADEGRRRSPNVG
jgi:dihydroorotase